MAKTLLLTVSIICFVATQSLIVHHNFETGMKPFSYQTFSGVAMYSPDDAPYAGIAAFAGDGKSYIDFDLTIQRDIAENDVFIELIVIPDININDIGFKRNGNLHLCCNVDLFGKYGCNDEHIGELIIPKAIKGLHRTKILMSHGANNYHLKTRVPVIVTSIYVFALATCDSNFQISYDKEVSITFNGTSTWINPSGHLPADKYPYLPFNGWMCLIYSILLILWIIINKIYSKALHAQKGIKVVLLISLVHTTICYVHFLNSNLNGSSSKQFVFGFIVSGNRGAITTMLFLALCGGYGVFKTLRSVSKKRLIVVTIFVIIYCGILNSIAHLEIIFDDLDFPTRTKVSSVMIFVMGIISICHVFGLLQSTITELTRKQSTKIIILYKSIRALLVITSCLVLIFSGYTMYFYLNELSFEQWNKIWFLDCWPEIVFLFSMIGIMILLRPSKNGYSQLNDEMKEGIDTHQAIQLSETDNFEGI